MPVRNKPFSDVWAYTGDGGNYTDVNGVTQTAAANVRRITYSGGVALGILIESSTNDVLKKTLNTESFIGGMQITASYAATFSAGQVIFQVDDGSEDNKIAVVSEAGGKVRMIVTVATVDTTDDSTIDLANGSSVVVNATQSDITLSVDGETAVSSGVSGFPFSSMTTLRAGSDSSDSNQLGGTIGRIQVAPNFVTTTEAVLEEDGSTELLLEDGTTMEFG